MSPAFNPPNTCPMIEVTLCEVILCHGMLVLHTVPVPPYLRLGTHGIQPFIGIVTLLLTQKVYLLIYLFFSALDKNL
jgi:hypothetical protein